MARHKGFVFYPEAWLSDARLSLCSYATKGVWMDLLCYMYQSQRGGYLMIEGKALSKQDAERMLKCESHEQFEGVWKELIDRGVMKQHADGTFYSKRLVEDMEKISLGETASKDELGLAQRVLEEYKKIVVNTIGYDGDHARAAIISLHRAGASFEDFRAVIKSKNAEWKDDDKMKRWIKPATLFGENFKRYLAESKAPERPQPKQGIAIIPRADYD